MGANWLMAVVLDNDTGKPQQLRSRTSLQRQNRVAYMQQLGESFRRGLFFEYDSLTMHRLAEQHQKDWFVLDGGRFVQIDPMVFPDRNRRVFVLDYNRFEFYELGMAMDYIAIPFLVPPSRDA